jgi:two-component system sensor histidine kinase BaeS
MARSVPLRHSLLVRLLAASVLIALCSIGATAWLAVQTTTRAIQQAQGQALSDDVTIYDTLAGYAATHSSWAGVGPTLQKLTRNTGRQITLTDQERVLIAGAAAAPGSLPRKESAVVDALHIDTALQPSTDSRIDSRVVGPYRLTPTKRVAQQEIATRTLECLTKAIGYPVANIGRKYGTPDRAPSIAFQDLAGYISIQTELVKIDPVALEKMRSSCGVQRLAEPERTEARALTSLTASVATCLKKRKRRLPSLTLPYDIKYSPADKFTTDRTVQNCLNDARREQFRAYVAPPVLLFVRSPGGVSQPRFDLSGANAIRIVGVATLVLLITVAVTVLVGARLVRPLRALTAEVQGPDGDHRRRSVTGKDEIGLLATALNNLTERRERADEQRTAMVSDVAHELRTPLTNIRSWLEAMEDGLATTASDPALNAALLREALQLQVIIDDLQDLAVADASGLRLSVERMSVGELVAQVITAHGGSADVGGVRLTADATAGLEVVADPVRLRQALSNLVSNAIRYTPSEGSVSLVARRDGDEVSIMVVDDGAGIAAEDLPHVFDRFWRADRSRSRDTGGSGLGLAIVRQIVEAHGGSVRATSVVGHGSCFILRLPAQPNA